MQPIPAKANRIGSVPTRKLRAWLQLVYPVPNASGNVAHSDGHFSQSVCMSELEISRSEDVPVLNRVSTSTWRYMGSGDIVPRILTLLYTRRRVLSFTSQPSYPQGVSRRCSLVKRLHRFQRRSGRLAETRTVTSSPPTCRPRHSGPLSMQTLITRCCCGKSGGLFD